jgi:SpoVK/Ycf46/Vps4 family AAA+-type ATPase
MDNDFSIEAQFTTPLISSPNGLYSLWKKEHEIDLDIFRASIEVKNPAAKKCIIDISLNKISDLLAVLKEYKYDENTEYNIDLKSLHNVKSELEQLNSMIGMETVKTAVLHQMIYFLQDLHIDKKGNSDYKHTMIIGPPGTGKTEMAKIIGNMYSKLGILKKNIFKKVTRSDLVAGYLGQTAIKTKTVINECLGGVLFIDEAYSLGDDSFSKECIDTLCEAMSDHKNDIMVIIAGYENELNDTFFRMNVGMSSRFVWRFKVDSYNSKELALIFDKIAKDQGWTTQDMKESWFSKNKEQFASYGRDMEILFSYVKIAHAKRIYGKDKTLRKCITKEDLEEGFRVFRENKTKKNEFANILESGLYV